MGIGRGKYSKKEFPGYKYRATVRIEYMTDGGYYDTMIDVYTDQKNRDIAEAEIVSRKTDKLEITSIGIINWTSKLQDKVNGEFIKEILKII